LICTGGEQPSTRIDERFRLAERIGDLAQKAMAVYP
jgi:hypothetical protein